MNPTPCDHKQLVFTDQGRRIHCLDQDGCGRTWHMERPGGGLLEYGPLPLQTAIHESPRVLPGMAWPEKRLSTRKSGLNLSARPKSKTPGK